MPNGTRDPRGAAASGASTVTWSALVGWLISRFAPEFSPMDVTMVVGGVLLVVHGAGTLARDLIHEREETEPERPMNFMVRQAAKYLG